MADSLSTHPALPKEPSPDLIYALTVADRLDILVRTPRSTIARPMNKFILYCAVMRGVEDIPGDHKAQAKTLANWWKQKPAHVGECYERMANELKDIHEQLYPNYKFSPKRKTQEPKNDAQDDQDSSQMGRDSEFGKVKKERRRGRKPRATMSVLSPYGIVPNSGSTSSVSSPEILGPSTPIDQPPFTLTIPAEETVNKSSILWMPQVADPETTEDDTPAQGEPAVSVESQPIIVSGSLEAVDPFFNNDVNFAYQAAESSWNANHFNATAEPLLQFPGQPFFDHFNFGQHEPAVYQNIAVNESLSGPDVQLPNREVHPFLGHIDVNGTSQATASGSNIGAAEPVFQFPGLPAFDFNLDQNYPLTFTNVEFGQRLLDIPPIQYAVEPLYFTDYIPTQEDLELGRELFGDLDVGLPSTVPGMTLPCPGYIPPLKWFDAPQTSFAPFVEL